MERQAPLHDFGEVASDHASIVNGSPETRTYVAEPIFIGEHTVFPSDLTPEDRELFEGFTPVNLEKYSDVGSFVADERPEGDLVGTLNFMGFFQNPETLSGMSHIPKPVSRRFSILYPEVVYELRSRLSDPEITSFADLDSETLEILFESYNRMSELVDINEATRRSSDGDIFIDLDYLKH